MALDTLASLCMRCSRGVLIELSDTTPTQRHPSHQQGMGVGAPGIHPGVTPQLLPSCRTGHAGLLFGCSSELLMIKTATRENQVKLTVSVPPSLHVLLRSWALCEGRELTSVVLQCVELSIRQLKSNGSIPSAAIRNYETACDERLAIGGL